MSELFKDPATLRVLKILPIVTNSGLFLLGYNLVCIIVIPQNVICIYKRKNWSSWSAFFKSWSAWKEIVVYVILQSLVCIFEKVGLHQRNSGLHFEKMVCILQLWSALLKSWSAWSASLKMLVYMILKSLVCMHLRKSGLHFSSWFTRSVLREILVCILQILVCINSYIYKFLSAS